MLTAKEALQRATDKKVLDKYLKEIEEDIKSQCKAGCTSTCVVWKHNSSQILLNDIINELKGLGYDAWASQPSREGGDLRLSIRWEKDNHTVVN